MKSTQRGWGSKPQPSFLTGFTLIELVVAVALLAMVLAFASVIFKVGIESYRTSSANAEIMQKLRAITDQLNRDFTGLQKDGYLILHSEVSPGRREYQNSILLGDFRVDRLYYFSTGDFQSWFAPGLRSNVSRVYFGHDRISLFDMSLDKPVSQWYLARDVELITPGIAPPPLAIVDYNNISYAEFKANVSGTQTNANNLLGFGIPIDIQNDPNSVRSLMCQNAGEIVIEWTDGTRYPPLYNSLAWFGISLLGVPMPRNYPPPYDSIEDTTNMPTYYRASWTPVIPEQYWPRALKFTFTLYDSKGILEEGRTFTHIVYVGD